jgi:Cu(I)/Ag(I) efflux system membrane fusion protein
VQDGLAAGELVVVNGAFKLDAELQIRGRPSMMQSLATAATTPAGVIPAGEHDHGHDPGHEGHDGSFSHEGDATDLSAGAPESFRLGLGRLVRSQFALVEALAGDDAEAARAAALAVDEALHEVDGKVLDGDAARSRWNELAAVMHDGLGALGRAPGLAGQRPAFERFSDALTRAVQSFGAKGAGTVYRAICPMVQGRDGYWLTDREEIANPYHGESMLRCGWIAETLVESGTAEDGPP